MGAFEWSVVVLLALILLRTGGGTDKRAEKRMLDSMVQVEALLASISTHLAEIDASTSSASHDISEMRQAQLPEYAIDAS